jgi:hypothetical protein
MPTDLGFCTHDAIAYPLLANMEMTTVKAMGGHKVRIGVWWMLVESTRGTYVFDLIDQAVNAARSQGLDVMLLLNNPVPTWASQASATEFGQFCAQAAQRYGPKGVVRYEILNEVNVYTNWNVGGPWGWRGGVNVAQVAAFHKAAYGAIKAVQPTAQVGGWGMAAVVDWPGGWFSWGPNQVAPANFVKQMIEAGCGPVDFITYHPYTLANDFTTWQPPTAAHPFNRQIINIHNVLMDKGLTMPIDLTEWGYPTSVFGEPTAATYTQNQWEILHSPTYAPLIRDHYVYCARDFAMPGETWSATNQEHTYGMTHQDLSDKPAARYFRSLP